MAVQERRQHDPHVVYHRFQLPAFDAYAYVAMAERPSVFAVAPWGYRLLTPSLVWASGGNPVRRFRQLTSAALVVSGVLLFAWLRRLGFVPAAALLGVAALALSPPFAQVVADPFYMEPVGLVLTLGVLLALEWGAGPGTLALLGVLLALAKDPSLVVALSPAVALSRWPSGGARPALAPTAAFLMPALLVKPILRAWWAPHIESVTAPVDATLFREAFRVFVEVWPATAAAILVGGVLPVALLGALRRRARPFLARYGPTLALLLALPFAAWMYVPSRTPVPLFGDNVQRLLLYPLPLLLALGLYAVDRVWPVIGDAPVRTTPRWLEWTAGAAAALVLLAPLVLLDRYRRLDLQGSRDGPLVLGFARETWRTAARLDRGDTVAFTPESHRYAWGESDPGRLGRMRWFLRQGWGDQAHYGMADIVMEAPAAELVLPSWGGSDVEMALALAAPGRRFAVDVNGRELSTFAGDDGASVRRIRIPAAVLFRGDNVVTLRVVEGGPGARLLSLGYRLIRE